MKTVSSHFAFQHRTELQEVINQYDIDTKEFCIVGSLCLSYRDIRPHGDVDLLFSPSVIETKWESIAEDTECREDGTIYFSDNVQAVSHGRYEQLGMDDYDVVHDPRYHDRINGFKIVRPELELSLKLHRRRQKDLNDVELIQEYALSAEEWDWSLVTPRNPYRQKKATDSESLPVRTVQSIRDNGIIYTTTEGIDLVLRSTPISNIKSALDKISETTIKNIRAVKQTPENNYPISKLIGKQYGTDNFERYDLFSLIANISEQEYEKRYDSSSIDPRCSELTSVSPVLINSKEKIVGNISTLAKYIIEGEESVPVRYKRGSKEIVGRGSIIESHDNKIDSERLEEIQRDVFSSYGIYFYILLWPPAADLFDNIESDIREKHDIISVREQVLENSFVEFVRDVYKTDDVEPWKIEVKRSAMSEYEPRISAIQIELPQPNFRKKSRTDSILSNAGAQLKKSIRTKYMDCIDGYKYDIIIHTGDNYTHNKKIHSLVTERFDSVNENHTGQ